MSTSCRRLQRFRVRFYLIFYSAADGNTGKKRRLETPKVHPKLPHGLRSTNPGDGEDMRGGSSVEISSDLNSAKYLVQSNSPGATAKCPTRSVPMTVSQVKSVIPTPNLETTLEGRIAPDRVRRQLEAAPIPVRKAAPDGSDQYPTKPVFPTSPTSALMANHSKTSAGPSRFSG